MGNQPWEKLSKKLASQYIAFQGCKSWVEYMSYLVIQGSELHRKVKAFRPVG